MVPFRTKRLRVVERLGMSCPKVEHSRHVYKGVYFVCVYGVECKKRRNMASRIPSGQSLRAGGVLLLINHVNEIVVAYKECFDDAEARELVSHVLFFSAPSM